MWTDFFASAVTFILSGFLNGIGLMLAVWCFGDDLVAWMLP